MKDVSLDRTGTYLKKISYEEWVRWHRSDDEETIANIATTETTPVKVFRTPDDKFGITPPPHQADTILFTYWDVPTDLSADTDTTSIPSRFDHVIIDGASEQLHLTRDNYESAGVARRNFKKGLQGMRTQLLNHNFLHVYDTRTSHALTRG